MYYFTIYYLQFSYLSIGTTMYKWYIVNCQMVNYQQSLAFIIIAFTAPPGGVIGITFSPCMMATSSR